VLRDQLHACLPHGKEGGLAVQPLGCVLEGAARVRHAPEARSTNTQFAVAVHVLTYLAGVSPGRAVSSEELSKSANVNPVYVRRVLGPLRSAKLVRSRPGVNGGWELERDAAQITLEQV